jgi:hypothetical protein
LVEERVVVDRPAACFGGLLSTSVRLGAGDYPVELEEVRVECAGQGCSYALAGPAIEESFEVTDGVAVLRRTGVKARRTEPNRAERSGPILYVASDAAPDAAGSLLWGLLDEHSAGWKDVARTYERAAKKELGRVKDPAERMATYLSSRPRLDAGRFWQLGFDWGEPVAAEQRPLLPLERWALSWHLLKKYDAVPVVLSSFDRAPPEASGIVRYSRVGLLLPGRGVLTDVAFIPTVDETAARLAGDWMVAREGDAGVVRQFPSPVGLASERWSGTATVEDKTVMIKAEGTLGGDWPKVLARNWERWLERLHEVPAGRRMSESRWQGRFVGHEIVGRTLRSGSFEMLDDGQMLAKATYGEVRATTIGGGIATMRLPLELHHQLTRLVPTAERHSDFALALADDQWNLRVVPPPGYRLAAPPRSVSVDEGPVQVSVTWTTSGAGARLEYALSIPERRVPAKDAASVYRAAEVVQALAETRLIFVRVER